MIIPKGGVLFKLKIHLYKILAQAFADMQLLWSGTSSMKCTSGHDGSYITWTSSSSTTRASPPGLWISSVWRSLEFQSSWITSRKLMPSSRRRRRKTLSSSSCFLMMMHWWSCLWHWAFYTLRVTQLWGAAGWRRWRVLNIHILLSCKTVWQSSSNIVANSTCRL